MNLHYAKILEVMGEPLWWDEAAVPRYVSFSPMQTANIYAEECVLEEVVCQDCGERFLVCLSIAQSTRLLHGDWTFPPHYGDPPNKDCCPAGPTMNVDFVRVVEHWKQVDLEWTRVDAASKEARA